MGSNTIINSIYVCNQSSQNGNVSVALYPQTLSATPLTSVGNSHFILKEQKIDAAESLILNVNMTMNAGTTLACNNAVRTGQGFSNVSISAFGVAIT